MLQELDTTEKTSPHCTITARGRNNSCLSDVQVAQTKHCSISQEVGRVSV